jgi:hypothetical protein
MCHPKVSHRLSDFLLAALDSMGYHRAPLKWIPDAVDLWQAGSTRCVLKHIAAGRVYEVCIYDGIAVMRSVDFDDVDRAIAFAVEMFRMTHREPLA